MPHSPDAAGATLEVGADLLEVRRLAALLRAACTAAAVPEIAAFDCELALVEAANNVVEHGYAGLGGGTIALEVLVNANEVRMTLTDNGRPAPEACFSQRGMAALDAVEGRGCAIIRAVINEIDYSSVPGMNSLTLIKRF